MRKEYQETGTVESLIPKDPEEQKLLMKNFEIELNGLGGNFPIFNYKRPETPCMAKISFKFNGDGPLNFSLQSIPTKEENDIPAGILIHEFVKEKIDSFTITKEDDGNFMFIDYNKEQIYKNPNELYLTDQKTLHSLHKRTITLECGGILLNSDNGKILSRPFSKAIDISILGISKTCFDDKECTYTELLDGEIVCPFLFKEQLLFKPRHGPILSYELSKVIKEYLETNFPKADEFIKFCISFYFTPIFIWRTAQTIMTTKKEKEEDKYKDMEPELVLIGIRHNYTGLYFSYETLEKINKTFGLKIVKQFKNSENLKFSEIYNKEANNNESLGYICMLKNTFDIIRIGSKKFWDIRSKTI